MVGNTNRKSVAWLRFAEMYKIMELIFTRVLPGLERAYLQSILNKKNVPNFNQLNPNYLPFNWEVAT